MPESERERIEQSNEVAAIVQTHAEAFIPLTERYGIADALWAAGYRRTEEQYTALMGNMPDGTVIDQDYPFPPLPASHVRRVYEGDWSPIPEGEEHEATSITFSPSVDI